MRCAYLYTGQSYGPSAPCTRLRSAASSLCVLAVTSITGSGAKSFFGCDSVTHRSFLSQAAPSIDSP